MNRLVYALLVVPFAAACGGSSSSSTEDLAHVGTTGDMAVSAAADMTAPPAPPQSVESCGAADYIDMTSATGTIAVTPWDTSLGKKCLRVKAGAKVSWAASTGHPLEATTGTTPTPLPAAPGASTATTVTFATAGVYGYQCHIHTTLMHGAIWVE